MLLQYLIENLTTNEVKGTTNVEIGKIEYDSKKIEKNDVFVAIKGYAQDGNDYITEAINKGAICVIVENDVNTNLYEGKDVTVVTNGETTAEVIEAAGILAEQGIDVEIVHLPMVKPIDKEAIVKSAKKTNYVVTVENHSVIGGVGSAVCEVLAEEYPVKVHRLGVQDTFGQSGDFDNLMKHYRLNSVELAEDIKKLMEEK